jgi:soluble lytic murein transglycosylase
MAVMRAIGFSGLALAAVFAVAIGTLRAESVTVAGSQYPAAIQLNSYASAAGLSQVSAESTIFEPASVRLPESAPEYRVLAAIRAGDREKAVAIAEDALANATESEAGRLHWLAAKASASDASKLSHLKSLAESSHPLSVWARLYRVELLRRRDPNVALLEAHPLLGAWTGRDRALTAYALALVQAGQTTGAVALLRERLKSVPSYQSAAAVALPLAEILADQPDIGSRQEALDLYRRVASRAPFSAAGKQARVSADAVLASLPPLVRSLFPKSLEDLLAYGEALVNARQYSEADQFYRRTADLLGAQPEARCKVLVKRGKALALQKKRSESVALFTEMGRTCLDPETKTWARYYAGRDLIRSGDPAHAITQLEALLVETPGHQLADDALYMSAIASEDMGDVAGKVDRLNILVDRYPQGDMKPTALFELAQNATSLNDFPAALTYFQRLIAEGTGENREGMYGRAAYWYARTLQRMERLDEAKQAYRKLITTYPLSYYAQQGLARLDLLDPYGAQRLRMEWMDREPERPLCFIDRPVLRNPAFQRATELLRVKEITLAKQELAWLAMVGSKAEPDLILLSATMLDAAGAYSDAIRLVRSRLDSFNTSPPKGKARRWWQIAFPRAYSPLIEKTAAEMGIPAAFLRAVAREESLFDANAVSSANAYGLVQVITSTARQTAKSLGLPSDPQSLKRPENNLRIGAAFLRFLWSRYPHHVAIVPAAYNAGNGAVERWLREHSGLELDAWVERIPYAETRRYTRLVIQSYGVYSWLESGRLPSFSLAVPTVDPVEEKQAISGQQTAQEIL